MSPMEDFYVAMQESGGRGPVAMEPDDFMRFLLEWRVEWHRLVRRGMSPSDQGMQALLSPAFTYCHSCRGVCIATTKMRALGLFISHRCGVCGARVPNPHEVRKRNSRLLPLQADDGELAMRLAYDRLGSERTSLLDEAEALRTYVLSFARFVPPRPRAADQGAQTKNEDVWVIRHSGRGQVSFMCNTQPWPAVCPELATKLSKKDAESLAQKVSVIAPNPDIVAEAMSLKQAVTDFRGRWIEDPTPEQVTKQLTSTELEQARREIGPVATEDQIRIAAAFAVWNALQELHQR